MTTTEGVLLADFDFNDSTLLFSQNCSNDSVHSDHEAISLSPEIKIFIITLICLIILVGVIGNITVILIVTRVKEMRKPVYYCLSSLAISDTLVLLILPLIPLVTLMNLPAGGVFGWKFCRFSGFFDRGVALASVLTVLMISVERYFAICHPFRAMYVLTTRRTLGTISFIWVISTAISFPYLEMVQYKEVPGPDNSTLLRCYFADHAWMLWYEVIVVCLFFFLPGVVLALLYFWIVRAVLMDRRHRQSMIKRDKGSSNRRNGSRKSKQVVFMLAGVVIMFIICVLPHNIFIVVMVAYPEISNASPFAYLAILWFCRIMMYINSAGNPVMYNVVSSEYRCALRKALRMRKIRSSNDLNLELSFKENGQIKGDKTLSTSSL